MGRRYAKGKHAVGICQRSGRKMLLKDMVSDGYFSNLIVDPDYYEPPHPQEYLPSIDDPVALWRPAPESSKETGTVSIPSIPPESYDPNIDANPLSFGFNIGGLDFETTPLQEVLLKQSGNGFEDGVTDLAGFTLDLTGQVEEDCLLVFLFWMQLSGSDIIAGAGNPANTLWVDTANVHKMNRSSACHYHWWEPGDTETFDFILGTAPGADKRVYYQWYALAGVNESQPFDRLNFTVFDETLTMSRAGVERVFPCAPPSMNSSTGALIELTTFDEDSLAGAPFDTNKSRSYDDTWSVEIETNLGSARDGWAVVGYEKPDSYDECLNLLTDCQPDRFDNWTYINGASVTEFPVAENAHSYVVDGIQNSGIHGIEQAVTLEAGRHCFYLYATDSASFNNIGVTYVDTASAEHGIVVQLVASASYLDVGGLVHSGSVRDEQVVGSGWDDFYWHMSQRFTGIGTMMYFFVDVVTPGEYKFRISTADGATAAAATRNYNAALAAEQCGIQMAGLTKGDVIPTMVFTQASPKTAAVASGPGFMNRSWFHGSSAYMASANLVTNERGQNIVFEVCGPTLTDASFIQYPGAHNQGAIVDQTNGLTSGVDFSGRIWRETNRNIGGDAHISRMVYPSGHVLGATGKYYCEFEFEPGAGTSQSGVSHPVVFLAPLVTSMNGELYDNNSGPGERVGESAIGYYGFNGQVKVKSATVATVNTWSAASGDVIGVAVDMTAGAKGQVEFFKNGSSEGTYDLDDGMNDRPIQVGVVNCLGSGSNGVTATLKAPFQYSKPSGFQDWDYVV